MKKQKRSKKQYTLIHKELRRSGRTLQLSITLIALALNHPFKPFRIKDHEGGTFKNICMQLESLIKKLNLESFEISVANETIAYLPKYKSVNEQTGELIRY